jgi:hypothetical protein
MHKELKTSAISKASVVGFLITAITIAVLPMLIVQPENRSEYFWQRILWTEFLAIIFWVFQGNFIAVVFPTGKDSKGLAGMLPSLGIVITFYTTASLILLLVHAWYPNNEVLNHFHLPAQVVIAAIALLTSIFLTYSLPAPGYDAEPIPRELKSPSELGMLLHTEEDRFSPSGLKGNIQDEVISLYNAIKSLREKLIYSLQGVGAIGTNQNYIGFVKDVQTFCQDISSLDWSNEQPKTLFVQFINQADQLKRRVDLIADSLKRR